MLSLALASIACVGSIGAPGRPSGEGGAGGSDNPDLPVTVVLADVQARVLSAPEYRNTVRDLLGLAVSPTLTQADWTAGFDNGGAIQIEGNLLSALVTEAESLSAQYVATRLAADFPCFAAASTADACVRTFIEQLGRRAYRRPLTTEQRDELFTFFTDAAAVQGSRTKGVEVLLTRLLTSAQFLYRSEAGTPIAAGSDRYALDDFEKASLVSYTLTGTMPDELLLADAEAGLLDEQHLRGHIKRLWAGAATRARFADFMRQWLKVTALDEMVKRPEAFPKLPAPAVGRSLKAEFDGFVGAVLFDGAGTLPALLSESFTIVDADTAPLYGLTATAPQRVTLDPNERKGVLTLASTMAAIASADEPEKDRPVKRGLMIKEQLLCEEVGPPSAVNTIAARETATMTPGFAEMTTRQQYEAMMQKGDECRSCHRQFMPLGFSFGAYDALGRYRTTQHGKTIDTAVTDVPFGGVARGFSGPIDLTSALAAQPATSDCFSKSFVSYTVGTATTEHAQTLTRSLTQRLGRGALSVPLLVEETLASPHLYVRRGIPGVPGGGTGGGGGGTGGGSGAGGGSGTGGGTGGTGGGSVMVATTVLLPSGTVLGPGTSRPSVGGGFTLIYQLDGNLVLYRANGPPLWASDTPGQTSGSTSMQSDGNLVVYDTNNVPRFNTGTHGNPGANLRIDAAGVLYVIATDGRVLWSSKGATP